MEQTTAIQPLQQRRQTKVLLQAEEYKCLPDHHMKEKVEGRTKNRIKRSSFTHELKKLKKDYPAVLTISNLPLSKQLTTTTDGSAGIIIQYPSGATQTASSATGKHCTNYRAETEARKQEATLVKDSLEPCSPTVVLTDAL